MIQEMIETLAAAKVAMEENPSLKAKIEHLNQDADAREIAYHRLSYSHTELMQQHQSAKDRIEQLEAELEAARFRELASRTRLDKVTSNLYKIIDEVTPASSEAAKPTDDMVEQPPELPVTAENDHFSDEIKTEWNYPLLVEDISPPQPLTELGIEEKTPREDYTGQPYSFKPDGVKWSEWIAGGGRRPWWLTDEMIAQGVSY